jgi:hypothetical protein
VVDVQRVREYEDEFLDVGGREADVFSVLGRFLLAAFFFGLL